MNERHADDPGDDGGVSGSDPANSTAEESDSGPVTSGADGTPLLVRALWFLFVGWWLVGIWLAVAWVVLVTVIGAPIGIKLINRVPFVLSLKRRRIENRVITEDGTSRIESSTATQPPLLARAGYFVLVGWWASLLWMAVAYLFTLTIVGLPIAIWMFGKLPFVVSLYRY